MLRIIELLALVAGVIGILAYVPQIIHMIKERSSKGISLGAWILWFVTGVIVLVYVLDIKDIIFISIQALNLIAIFVVLVLTLKYSNKKNNRCKKWAHGDLNSRPPAGLENFWIFALCPKISYKTCAFRYSFQTRRSNQPELWARRFNRFNDSLKVFLKRSIQTCFPSTNPQQPFLVFPSAFPNHF